MTDKLIDDGNEPQLSYKRDSFLAKAIVLVAVLFISETALWLTGTSFVTFVFIFLIDLVVLIIAVILLFVGIKQIVHGHYRFAMPLILIIPLLMLAFSQPSKILFSDGSHFGYAHDIAYYIKLTLHEKQYLEEVRLTQPKYKGFQYAKFRWFTEGDEWTDLVYDESDELGVSHIQDYAACPYVVNKIKSHFYVVRVTCG